MIGAANWRERTLGKIGFQSCCFPENLNDGAYCEQIRLNWGEEEGRIIRIKYHPHKVITGEGVLLAAPGGWRSEDASANKSRLLRTSMAKTKNIGDRGSPWRRPRPCQMGQPGRPFSKIRVDEEKNMMQSQGRHLGPKPFRLRTSKRNGHEFLINMLKISNCKLSILTICITGFKGKI